MNSMLFPEHSAYNTTAATSWTLVLGGATEDQELLHQNPHPSAPPLCMHEKRVWFWMLTDLVVSVPVRVAGLLWPPPSAAAMEVMLGL